MPYANFVPRNTTKLTTRGGTSPDGVEMTLIRERKATHRLGTRLIAVPIEATVGPPFYDPSDQRPPLVYDRFGMDGRNLYYSYL